MYFFGTLALIATALVIYGWIQDYRDKKGWWSK